MAGLKHNSVTAEDEVEVPLGRYKVHRANVRFILLLLHSLSAPHDNLDTTQQHAPALVQPLDLHYTLSTFSLPTSSKSLGYTGTPRVSCDVSHLGWQCSSTPRFGFVAIVPTTTDLSKIWSVGHLHAMKYYLVS